MLILNIRNKQWNSKSDVHKGHIFRMQNAFKGTYGKQIQFTKTANQPDQGLKGPSSASLPRMTDCLSQFSLTMGTLKLTVVLEG